MPGRAPASSGSRVKPPVKGSPVLSRISSWRRSDLVRGHRVAVLRLGVAARAHVLGERLHALDHLRRGRSRSASRSARRGRRRCQAGRGRPAPARRSPAPAPIPITGICMRGMISSVSAAGMASNTIAKQPASWRPIASCMTSSAALGRAALRAVAAERGRRLRREADVAHHGDAGRHDRAGALDRGAAALELDGVAAGLLDEALRRWRSPARWRPRTSRTACRRPAAASTARAGPPRRA